MSFPRVTSSPNFTPQNPGFTWSYAWGEPQVSWSDRELEHRGQAKPVSYLPCRILSPAWVFSSLLSSIPRSPLEACGRVREKTDKGEGCPLSGGAFPGHTCPCHGALSSQFSSMVSGPATVSLRRPLHRHGFQKPGSFMKGEEVASWKGQGWVPPQA